MVDGATSACISTRIGRVPSIPANTTAPDTFSCRSARNNSDGLKLRPDHYHHFKHADFIGWAKAIFDTARCGNDGYDRLQVKNRINHMFQHFGASNRTIFRHMPDNDNGRAFFTAALINSNALARTWLTVPGFID